MEQTQVQETVNTPPTPSRTIRVTHDGDYSVSTNHGITRAENGRRFLVFSTVDDAIKAYNELKTAEVKASYLTYSLFVKFQDELSQDTLKTKIIEFAPNSNVTYLRVDENLHTGKVVVDLLTDYQSLKALSNDNLRFFHFDPKRVRPRREQEGQWSQVQSRQRRQLDSGGDRQQGGYQRSHGSDRPQGRGDRPQGRGDRPQGSYQRQQGDRQQGDRPQGDRPQGDRQQGGRGTQRSKGTQGGRGGRGSEQRQGGRGSNTNAV